MQSVKYERSGAVGHIVLCHPPHNLLNVEFYEQLREAVVGTTSDDLVRKLADGPTRSYAAVRQILKAWSSGGVAGADAVMLDVALPLHATADAARGRAARAEALARGEEPKPVIFEGR